MFDKHKGSKLGETQDPFPGELSHGSAPVSPAVPASGKSALIGPGISVDGDISGNENLLIEGKVKGSIKLGANEVSVGRSGVVDADVTAKSIRIAGRVTGDLHASEKVIINGTGHVRGNVVAPRVVLEDGAVFKGSIDMDPGESAVSRPVSSAKTASAPELVSTSSAGRTADLALKSG